MIEEPQRLSGHANDCFQDDPWLTAPGSVDRMTYNVDKWPPGQHGESVITARQAKAGGEGVMNAQRSSNGLRLIHAAGPGGASINLLEGNDVGVNVTDFIDDILERGRTGGVNIPRRYSNRALAVAHVGWYARFDGRVYQRL